MRNPIAIPSTLLSLLITSHASPTHPHQSPLGPSPSPYPSPSTAIPYTFRNATLDDIDDITTVWYEAFRPGPLWNYMYQFTDDVGPLYRWTCQRETVRRIFREAASQDMRTNVITVQVPDPSTSTPSSRRGDFAATTREKVVSLAMWEFNQTGGRLDGEDDSSPAVSMSLPMLLPMGLYSSDGSDTSPGLSSPFNCSAHLDVNMTRARHYTEIMEAAYVKYLREAVGPQLYLGLLATHPGWDGNGFGAAHLRWGKARLGAGPAGGGGEEGSSLPLTLIATPAGYPLYVSEGFEGLKNVTLERLDGAGVIWHEVMKFEEGGGRVDEL